MKKGVKLVTGLLLVLGLSACGDGEEEIVYEESPYDIPLEYSLGEDSAPGFYADVFSYISENIAPPIETTEIPEGKELTKEEEKYLKEEEEKLTAANDLLQAELDKENNRLGSIRVVSVTDPSEKNADAIAARMEIYEEEKAEAAAIAAAEFQIIPDETEEQLSSDDDATLTATVVVEEDFSFLEQVEQDGYVYHYDLSTTGYSGGQATSGYASHMLSAGFKIIDPFHPVGIEYYSMLTPDFTQRAGTVAFAKKASGTDRLILVMVDWYNYGATVSIEYISGKLWVAPKVSTTQKTSLSINDVVGFLETRNPADLGLSGMTMEDYNVYTSEALVIINGETYRQFNITGKATGGNGSTYGGVFLVNADGNTFTVDNYHSTVIPLNVANIYDTLN